MKHRRKTFFRLIFASCLMLAMIPLAAFASSENVSSDTTTKVVNSDETLRNALTNANGSTTIKLGNDFELTSQLEIPAGKDIILDLNGKSLTIKSILVNGNLTVCDTTAASEPTVDSNYDVTYNSGKILKTTGGTAISVKENGVFTLQSGTIDASKAATAIYITGDLTYLQTSPTNPKGYIQGGYVHSREYGVGVGGANAEVTIAGGVIEADDNAVVAGNGSLSDSSEKYPDGLNYSNTTINISGGTMIGNIVANGYIACGVYHPQKGQLNMTGGTLYVKGGVGVLMRAGNADITGGEIIATGDESIKGKVGDAADVISGNGVVYNTKSSYPGLEDSHKVTISGNASISCDIKNIVTVEDGESGDDQANRVDVAGGTFSKKVDPKYLNDSISAEVESSSNNETTFSYFKTVQEALNSAPSGSTINLLASDDTSEREQYSVTVNYNNGNAGLTYKVHSGDTIPLPSTPTRSGYNFGGWSDGTTVYNAGQEVTISANTTFNAVWYSIPEPSYNYGISLPADTENGTISIPKEDLWASAGEKITITVTPDAGYMLDELTITADGKEIEYTDNGDGTYTFTMPSSSINIEATFIEDPNYEEPSDEPETPTDVTEIFTDVEAGAWYEDAIQYVFDNGIMTGTSDSTFEPNTATTRGMIVSMLHRLEGSPEATSSDFSDVANGAWYADPVAWASANSIVGGYDDGTFQPNKAISREELASILFRYAHYKGYDTTAQADLSHYTDSPSAWAMDVMSWANAEGLINGRTATTIDAQDETTRAECAAIFQRYIENIAE